MQSPRGRGLICKASNGLVQFNTFTNTKLESTAVTPELFFLEGDWAHNITLDSNLVRSSPAGVYVGYSYPDGSPSRQQTQNFVSLVFNVFLDVPLAPAPV